MNRRERKLLQDEHDDEAIRRRLSSKKGYSYVGDAVLGAIDGCVSTYAVVAGAVGGSFTGVVVVVLGFANLIADGFSMAVSNFLRAGSDSEQLEEARRTELKHIREIPEGERQEIRQIYEQKGLQGETLDKVVEEITRDPRLWVDTMLSEELGLQVHRPRALRSAVSTFVAFALAGFVPLLPFVIPYLHLRAQFLLSTLLTFATFLGIGMAKGIVLHRSPARSGLFTLLTGGGAAVLAYLAGWLLRQFITGE